MSEHRPIKVLAICGSLSTTSANLRILMAAKTMIPEVGIEIFEGLADLPAFNPDHIEPLVPVIAFREKISKQMQ